MYFHARAFISLFWTWKRGRRFEVSAGGGKEGKIKGRWGQKGMIIWGLIIEAFESGWTFINGV